MARKPTTETSTANLGFEQKLWLVADLQVALSRGAEFCRLLLEAKPIGGHGSHSLSAKIAGLGRGTGYELMVMLDEAMLEKDDLTAEDFVDRGSHKSFRGAQVQAR